MMKRYVVRLLVLCCFMLVASTAGAVTVAEVGAVDQLLGETHLSSSGDAAELAWVESVLGFAVDMGAKYDTTGGEWSAVTGLAGVFAHVLSTSPEYFLIKTGNVTSDGNTHFLFRNLAELTYAVIDLGILDFNSITNVSGISHIDEFGGTPIPEPGTMMLLGSGLVGLAGWGRKKFRREVA